MFRRRAVLALLASAFFVLAQLSIWSAPACSMCGASCRCTAHVSGASCAFRSVGCGGGDATGSTVGSVSPLRAVIVASVGPALPPASQPGNPVPAPSPVALARPPLDHPPRVSC